MVHQKGRRYPRVVTTGTLLIPGDKPDIDFLLRVTSTPVIEHCIADTRQIRIIGYFNIFIEYVAAVADGTQPITFLFAKLPFDEAFHYRHARAGVNIHLKCRIKAQDLQLTTPREMVLHLEMDVLRVKLVPTQDLQVRHQCKPYLVNFLETGNTQRPVSASNLELGFEQPDRSPQEPDTLPALPESVAAE